ncbi:MAG: hydrogenase iron-sulfur subunit [Promethearchaeota archaeon]|nr:MAG: hydrogenase iron-sulfur subunit [Candidatus Lokiarchaeota archaeon]
MTEIEPDVDIKPSEQKQWSPKILAFLCNWCSYAGADLAGVSRIQYPPNIRIVRIPCSGRINPLFILKALQVGWDGVLVSGCHPGDCHYISGNFIARRKFSMLNDLLTFVGIEPGRVNFTWVSAAEGEGFAKIVRKVTERVRKLGPNKRFKPEKKCD